MKFQAGFTPRKVDLSVPAGEIEINTRLAESEEPGVEVVAIRAGDEDAEWMVKHAAVERSGDKLVVRVPERDGGSGVTQYGGSLISVGRGSMVVGSVGGRVIVNGNVVVGTSGVRVTVKIAAGTDVKVRGTNPDTRIDGALASLNLRTTNGGVLANDHLSDAEIETTNGTVELELVDRAEIHTTNGGINVGLVREAAKLRTTNGGIHATTATDNFTARATNGGVRVYTVDGVVLDEDAVSTTNGSRRVSKR